MRFAQLVEQIDHLGALGFVRNREQALLFADLVADDSQRCRLLCNADAQSGEIGFRTLRHRGKLVGRHAQTLRGRVRQRRKTLGGVIRPQNSRRGDLLQFVVRRIQLCDRIR